MQKLDLIKITKSDEKIIYAIGHLTLEERKKSTKTTHQDIANFCQCSEKTVQRAIIKLEKAKLITRGIPKFKRSAWFINISSDFYIQTKTIFLEQKKLSSDTALNVHPRIITNTSISNKTKTEIEKNAVQFFVSEKILELDLKNLTETCGLIHSDLEFISRKAGWHNSELQYSLDNFALALETKTFIATKLTPREAFISILTGSNGKKEPKLFNRPQELLKQDAVIEKEALKNTIENQEEVKKLQEKEQKELSEQNYWLSLSSAKQTEYLSLSNNDLKEAIKLANDRMAFDHEEFSISKILEKIEALEEEKRPHNKGKLGSSFNAKGKKSNQRDLLLS